MSNYKEKKYYEIKISWTDWLEEKSRHYKENCVLYMYATTKEPAYIGKAGKQNVLNRLKDNTDRGVAEWIIRNYNDLVRIKVGYPDFHSTDCTEEELEILGHIESLLIYIEYNQWNHCLANIHFRKSISKPKFPLHVFNYKHYRPLVYEYHLWF